jgi:8-oxo-dGTP diphosphatase
MREWLVAGALVELEEGLLLVQNRRQDGRVDWTPPGGVVDPGEELLDGLTREVTEETGLVVSDWSEPVYEIQAVAPDLDWHLTVVVHRALAWDGELCVADPDGIVVDACYVAIGECNERLAGAPPWVRDPLGLWLNERWDTGRAFRFQVEGTDHRSLRVSALP